MLKRRQEKKPIINHGLVIALLCSSATAQWITGMERCNFPINCLVVSGMKLFAGSDKGVFRSTNNGTSWTAVHSGLMSICARAFAVVDTTLSAGLSAPKE